MRFRGRFKGIQRDWQTNMPLITFELTEGNIDEVNGISDKDLVVEAKKYSKKKTNNQNSYLWELIGKIATHKDIKSTPNEIYENLIQDMCIPMTDENDSIVKISLKSNINVSIIKGHWRFFERVGDMTTYYMLRGSSTYDTAEMTKLIELAVDKAKGLGIETLTPDELEKLRTISNGEKTMERIHK